MQLDFLSGLLKEREQPGHETLLVGSKRIPLSFVRNLRARRYVLRVGEDAAARVTIPRGGSQAAAYDFVRRHLHWIEKQLLRPARPRAPKTWSAGTEILFRGEPVLLRLATSGAAVEFADQVVAMAAGTLDWRPALERHLWKLAAAELEPRTWEFAQLHAVTIRRAHVRNQSSRWGSCSVQGTISLNWRLIQTPDFVRDYIILHELMHRREMNHSKAFWRQVQQVCPAYREAEVWLKKHASLVR